MAKKEEFRDRQYTLVLPKVYDGKKIPDEEVDKVAKKISKRFGGVTITDGEGGWVSGSGEYIEEPVYIFEIDRDIDPESKEIIERDKEWLEDLGAELGDKFNQDVILETTDKIEMKMVSSSKKERQKKKLLEEV